MYRNRYTASITSFGVNVVTSVNAFQFPTFGLQEATESFSTHYFQTAISITLSFPEIAMS
jgi:hypothetical protein